MMIRAIAFVRRGWRLTMSYPSALVLSFLNLVVTVSEFAFLSRFVGGGAAIPSLAAYDGNLLAYLVIGTSFSGFVGLSFGAFQSAIRSEQNSGTLEVLLTCGTRPLVISLFSSIWSIIFATINAAITFVLLYWLFGMRLIPNAVSMAVTYLASILSVTGIGLMASGLTMVVKQGEPISWLFSTLSSLAAGALFPVEFLPPWLRPISYTLPTTYAVSALRKSLVMGMNLAGIRHELLVLLLFGIALLPAGIYVFTRSYDSARRRGSLLEY